MSDDVARNITVAGLPVRLYPAPKRSGEFAWANFDDLLQAADVPLTAISLWAERWRMSYPDRHGVAADGCILVPTEAATGLFEAARRGGSGRAKRAIIDFRHGVSELLLEAHRQLDEAAFGVASSEARLRAMVTEGLN